MHQRRSWHRQATGSIAALVFAVLFLPSGASAADLSGSLVTVDKLIHHSSAATQVLASGNEAAKAKHKEAETLYQRAVAAAGAGRTDAANDLLTQTKQTMIEAVQLAGRESVVNEKKRADFTKRLESVEALLAAYDRVRAEKEQKGAHDLTGSQVRDNVERAQEHLTAGRVEEARTVLDEAYLVVKLGIERLRAGDTLVRSLHFASKEEEYRYELDRNDTHRMLVELLLKEKLHTSETGQIVLPLLDRATELRQQAEAAAAASRYESAVTMLEQSTAELVHAIRAAGIYIPA